jgi:hypothetical protein
MMRAAWSGDAPSVENQMDETIVLARARTFAFMHAEMDA